MFSRFSSLFGAALAGLGMTRAGAQSIARVQLTDNDLSCSQIYAESRQIDTVMKLTGSGLAAASVPARIENPNASVN